jgi:hypothetical protein
MRFGGEIQYQVSRKDAKHRKRVKDGYSDLMNFNEAEFMQ